MSRPGTALNGDAPKAMVAKILGFQAKEEEESPGMIQQLNTNVRTLMKCQGCRMNAKAAVPRLQVAFRDRYQLNSFFFCICSKDCKFNNF